MDRLLAIDKPFFLPLRFILRLPYHDRCSHSASRVLDLESCPASCLHQTRIVESRNATPLSIDPTHDGTRNQVDAGAGAGADAVSASPFSPNRFHNVLFCFSNVNGTVEALPHCHNAVCLRPPASSQINTKLHHLYQYTLTFRRPSELAWHFPGLGDIVSLTMFRSHEKIPTTSW